MKIECSLAAHAVSKWTWKRKRVLCAARRDITLRACVYNVQWDRLICRWVSNCDIQCGGYIYRKDGARAIYINCQYIWYKEGRGFFARYNVPSSELVIYSSYVYSL